MGEPKIIEKLVDSIDIRNLGDSFDSAIKHFEYLKDSYSDQKVFLSCDSDSVIIVERRLETPLEQDNRETLEARHATERERIDRETLARLKKQYEV